MLNPLKYGLLLLLFTGITIETKAQDENLKTDRPGVTLTPFTTPKKLLQIETGLSFENFEQSGNNTSHFYEHPQLVIKYGLFKNFELRSVTTLGTISKKYFGQKFSSTGLSELQFGFKFNFLEEKKIIPQTSLVMQYMFNSLNGIRAHRRDTLDGLNIRLAMQNTVSTAFSVNYNVGIEWPAFIRKHTYTYSLSPKFYFSEKWMIYVEAFGNIWNYKSPQHNFGGGISYSINNNIKLDAGYSRWRPVFERSNQFSIGISGRLQTRK